MSEDVLVKVDGVCKKFCRSLKKSLWYGVRDIAGDLFGRDRSNVRLRAKEFWALKDVSFELRRGECLGLIGRNGAGKSTLLRLLNGLIIPDKGRISVRGRIGALIELGAGFNPVLTGRENVYVNAAVLGISKRRVDEIIGSIIDFSGIEEFIDTPVMSYSSGMKVRLGFAVAAELEPDVLLIDEVLAVGDLSFRTKCLNRLNEMKGRGMSFILVSHHMTNVVQFTKRALWLDKSRLVMDGPALEVIKAYVNSCDGDSQISALYGQLLTDHPDVESASVRFAAERREGHAGTLELVFGESLTIEYSFRTKRELASPNISFPIYHENGTLMTTVASIASDIPLRRSGKNAYSGKVRFGPVNFNPANYIVVANLHDGPQHLYRSVVGRLSVSNDARMTWGMVDFNQDWQMFQPVQT